MSLSLISSTPINTRFSSLFVMSLKCKILCGLSPQLSLLQRKACLISLFTTFYLGSSANVFKENSQEKNKTINLIDKGVHIVYR